MLANRTEAVVIGLLAVGLTVSFWYGWYWDRTKPVGGLGWADQTLYTTTAARLGSFDLPTAQSFHYQMGYPLLGALGYQVMPSNPFMPVSLSLLLATATFGYLAVRALLGWTLAALFVASLFAWDFVGRSLNFASELFVTPWNNQVLLFVFAFFFWVFAARVGSERTLSTPLIVAVGLVAGYGVATREETLLFIVPLVVLVLVRSKASVRGWMLCGSMMVLALLPHLLLKWAVVGDVTATGRRRDYAGFIETYLGIKRLARNAIDVVIHSSIRGEDFGRQALLQAAPWLWLAPIGLTVAMLDRSLDAAVKWFLVISGVVFLFYLAGENVSGQKLQFGCIRYLTPAFPALHFGVVYLLARTPRFGRQDPIGGLRRAESVRAVG